MTTRKKKENECCLKRLSVIQRLEAAERYYRQHDERFADGLLHAAEIAQADGWKHIAPAWRGVKTRKVK